MTETTISVQGHHTAWYTAERANVTVMVGFDGPERDPVFSAATETLEAVRATVTPLYDASTGPITRWAAESVRVWSDRPWNSEGKQLPVVHRASLDLTATFTDFDVLAQWIEQVIAIDGTNLTSINWTLTDATQTSATTEVRSRAVKDAVAKASVYAQSIGLGSVSATAIADPGMLGDGNSAGSGFGGMDRMMMKSDGSGSLELKPEQIEVSASVDARFIAR